jgi:hypothetical protein
MTSVARAVWLRRDLSGRIVREHREHEHSDVSLTGPAPITSTSTCSVLSDMVYGGDVETFEEWYGYFRMDTLQPCAALDQQIRSGMRRKEKAKSSVSGVQAW